MNFFLIALGCFIWVLTIITAITATASGIRWFLEMKQQLNVEKQHQKIVNIDFKHRSK